MKSAIHAASASHRDLVKAIINMNSEMMQVASRELSGPDSLGAGG